MSGRMELFQKYIITKSDGSPVDDNARYFVLRVDKNDLWGKICRRALRQFSRDVEVMMGEKAFADHIRAYADAHTPAMTGENTGEQNEG
jgi:hypothetical protein